MLPQMKERLNALVKEQLTPEDLKQKVTIDAYAKLHDFNQKFMADMRHLEPFGCENEQPTFAIEDVVVVQKPQLLKEVHVKCSVFADGVIKPLIFFNRPDIYTMLVAHEHDTFSLAAQVQENHWNGRSTIELTGVDIAIKETK